MGLQASFTKHCCFLCLWDVLAIAQHYEKELQDKKFICTRSEKYQHIPLVTSEKVLMPPLHIKLGLKKNFVKPMVNRI